MYNKLYRYFTEHNILYSKTFGFQRNNSTLHAIIQLYVQMEWKVINNLKWLSNYLTDRKQFILYNAGYHKVLF